MLKPVTNIYLAVPAGTWPRNYVALMSMWRTDNATWSEGDDKVKLKHENKTKEKRRKMHMHVHVEKVKTRATHFIEVADVSTYSGGAAYTCIR